MKLKVMETLLLRLWRATKKTSRKMTKSASVVKAEEFIDNDDEGPVGVHAVVFGTRECRDW